MNATNRSNARRIIRIHGKRIARIIRIHGKRIARIHACIDNVATALAWAALTYGAMVALTMVALGLVQA